VMSINDVDGAPGTIRTSDPQIRSLVLYPAELRARVSRIHAGRSRPTHAGLSEKARERAP
jgi:hypothetical protein